jgi:hypothetical protein
VEGKSEIDLIIESRRFLIFLEAKLGSDITMGTAYDPARNQIVRNIDCLLECVKDRIPVFWMLTRDTDPGRAYMQIIQLYRSRPDILQGELPHRSEASVRAIAARLSIIRWQDLGAGWIEAVCSDPSVEDVRQELVKRIHRASRPSGY